MGYWGGGVNFFDGGLYCLAGARLALALCSILCSQTSAPSLSWHLILGPPSSLVVCPGRAHHAASLLLDHVSSLGGDLGLGRPCIPAAGRLATEGTPRGFSFGVHASLCRRGTAPFGVLSVVTSLASLDWAPSVSLLEASDFGCFLPRAFPLLAFLVSGASFSWMLLLWGFPTP